MAVLAFTNDLWAGTADLRRGIDELEFLERLGDGTLPLDDFAFYLRQDAHYLAGYAKALALLAARSPQPEAAAFWATSSHTAAVVETSLHRGILNEIGGADVVEEHSPACLGYVSYVIATAATAPYPVAAAALLPCFWIYGDVAARLAKSAATLLSSDPEHPYATWVATYDDEGFQASVLTARQIVEEAAASASAAERAAMTTAFTFATRYELLFWHSALDRQPWPSF